MVDISKIWAQLATITEEPEQKRECDWRICAECGAQKIMDVLPTCPECGLCDDAFISDEPEWRGGMDDNGDVSDPSRCGAPTDTRFSESWSMGTIMNVRTNASYAMKKLARIDFHTSMNHKDRSLFHGYADIERAGKNLPKHVLLEAEEMYRKFGQEKLTRGAVRTGIKANCLLQACKTNNIGRSIEEMAQSFGIETKDISRTRQMFVDTVKPQSASETINASNVAARMLNDFTEIPDAEKRRARMRVINICSQIQECDELVGRTPKTIAATVITVILEPFGITCQSVSSATQVSVVTIKKIEAIVRKKIQNGPGR
jgi:transcription initiation factor TFIIB